MPHAQLVALVAVVREQERKKGLAVPPGLVREVAVTRQAVEDARDTFAALAAQVAEANRTIGFLQAQIAFLGAPELLVTLAGELAVLKVEEDPDLQEALVSAKENDHD